jgi:type 1 glutamine amidotransferase
MRRFVRRAGLAFVLGALTVWAVAPAQAQEKGQGKKKGADYTEKITAALPEKGQVQPKQPRKLLIFSKTASFRHGSIPTGIKALTMMGDKTGAYSAYATEDESIFEPEKLNKFDAVLMLNTTSDINDYNNPFRPKDAVKGEVNEREEMLKKSLVDFVSSGKGLAGIHAAGDTYHKWKDYNMMMGGAFVKHPWNAGDTVSIKNVEPSHPLNAAFDGKGFDIKDEIYVFRDDTALPTERKFLLTLDETKMDTKKGGRKDGLYAISWVSTFGKGRTFYCSLGHNDAIYFTPAVLKHYLAGLQYVMGDLPADATPAQK